MKVLGLGKYKNLHDFVSAKVRSFETSSKNFSTLFELMFSEKENIMFEYSEGYRIVKKTYGEVYDAVKKRAASLHVILKDSPDNSVVALNMDNSPLWVEMFWTILAAGFRPLLLNLRLDKATLEKAMSDTNTVAVISDIESFNIKTIKSEEIKTDTAESTGYSFGSEILLMTSGTSDSVKICAYSAEEFYYQVSDSAKIITECKLMKAHYEGHLKQLVFLPLYHIFGLVAVYTWFTFFSRTLVMLKDLSPSTIQNTVKRHKVTHIFAVPLFWETVYESALKEIKGRGEKTYKKFCKGIKLANKFPGKAFSKFALKEVREGIFGDSLRFLISGGSEIRPEVISFFNGIGYHLANGYGMTEIGITSVELTDKKKYLNECYVGKPFSSISYKISEEGELLVKGKSTAKYILENGTVTERGEWFNTHDLAEEKDGHFRILGRKDDIIITANGENVNPNMIEPLFMIGGVNDVCLTKITREEKTVPLLLVSVDKYITDQGFEKLEKEVREIAAKQKNLPQLVIEFIKNPLIDGNEFKKNRKHLAKSYEDEKFSIFKINASKDEGEEDELMKAIHEIFAFALDLPAERISQNDDFFLDAGGTSLAYLAMTAKLEEEFGVHIVFTDDTNLRTVKQIYDYIKEKREES